MELDFLQIKQLTVGAIAVSKDDAGIFFRRFIPAQRDAFGAVSDLWAQRSDATAGIRIDLHTDATRFCAQVAACGQYELLVDDLLTYCETINAGDTIVQALDGNDHRITLVLPCHAPGKIKWIRLEGETYVKAHRYTKKVAFYGDSITQGANADVDSQSYTWLLTRFFDWNSINFGVGGIRFQPETVVDVGCDPDIVFIALGTNNFGSNRPMELLKTNCPEYFDRIATLYPTSKIFCITPIWRADGDVVKNLGTIHDARKVIAEEAEKRGFTVIDGFTLVPHRIAYYEDARLHPNDLGFALYTQNLIKALMPYL